MRTSSSFWTYASWTKPKRRMGPETPEQKLQGRVSRDQTLQRVGADPWGTLTGHCRQQDLWRAPKCDNTYKVCERDVVNIKAVFLRSYLNESQQKIPVDSGEGSSNQDLEGQPNDTSNIERAAELTPNNNSILVTNASLKGYQYKCFTD